MKDRLTVARKIAAATNRLVTKHGFPRKKARRGILGARFVLTRYG